MKKRANLPYKNIPCNTCRYPLEDFASFLECRLDLVTPSFSKNKEWGGKSSDLTMQKPSDTFATTWSRWISPVMIHLDVMYHLVWYNEKGETPLWYSLKNQLPKSKQERYQTDNNDGHATKCLTSAFQNSQGYGKLGKTENCSILWKTTST